MLFTTKTASRIFLFISQTVSNRNSTAYLFLNACRWLKLVLSLLKRKLLCFARYLFTKTPKIPKVKWTHLCISLPCRRTYGFLPIVPCRQSIDGYIFFLLRTFVSLSTQKFHFYGGVLKTCENAITKLNNVICLHYNRRRKSSLDRHIKFCFEFCSFWREYFEFNRAYFGCKREHVSINIKVEKAYFGCKRGAMNIKSFYCYLKTNWEQMPFNTFTLWLFHCHCRAAPVWPNQYYYITCCPLISDITLLHISSHHICIAQHYTLNIFLRSRVGCMLIS